MRKKLVKGLLVSATLLGAPVEATVTEETSASDERRSRSRRAASAVLQSIEHWRPGAGSAERSQADSLDDVLKQRRPWNPDLLPAALSTAHGLAHTGALAGRRRATLGDILTAIGGLPHPEEEKSWTFEPAIDPHAFNVLGFDVGSEGIEQTQRENREGWWKHARHNRAFILDAAMQAPHKDLAVVLGAGKAFDLPVEALATRFKRVILMDIDAQSLAATRATVVSDGELSRRIELRAMDVTGVCAKLAHGIERVIAEAPDGHSAAAALERLCRSYHLASPPRFLAPGERADLLVSGLVLSQLGLAPKVLAKQRFEQRFGALPQELEARWYRVWDELGLRIQQDHVNALADQADLAVLTSDVVHQGIAVGRNGRERPSGVSWSVLGTDSLEERVPAHMKILAQRAWTWPRIRPKPPSFDGVHTAVGGVLLRLEEGLTG